MALIQLTGNTYGSSSPREDALKSELGLLDGVQGGNLAWALIGQN